MLPADVQGPRWAAAMLLGWLIAVALAAVVGVYAARIARHARKGSAAQAEWRRRMQAELPGSADVTRHVYTPRHRRVLPPPSPDAARVRILAAAGRRVVAAVRKDGGVRA